MFQFLKLHFLQINLELLHQVYIFVYDTKEIIYQYSGEIIDIGKGYLVIYEWQKYKPWTIGYGHQGHAHRDCYHDDLKVCVSGL